MNQVPVAADASGASALHKVMWRLVPFSILLFFVQMTDKTNVSFAALQMNQQLGFTPEIYGFGAGIFFLGAFLFQLPSNLILLRVGARRWLASITITWALIVIAMAWVKTPSGFYLLRFLLGMAEAGLLPGIMYHLGNWIPEQRRGMATAWVLATAAIGPMLGAPLATGLMEAQAPELGLRGWQCLFIVEGAVTVWVGVFTLNWLPSSPHAERWLSPVEKEWLTDTLARELAVKERAGMTRLSAGFLNRRVLLALAIGFFLLFITFGTIMWLPQMIKAFGGLTDMEVGLLSALPFACGAAGMIYCGRRSDRTRERRPYVVGAAALSAVGFACAGLASTQVWSFVGLCLGMTGILSTFGVFWAYASDLLGGRAAASGLAFINTSSQLGAFLGPICLGYLKQASQTFNSGLLLLSVCAIATALIALSLRSNPRAPEAAVISEAAA
jgi:ACS family tartrate transporter-like MFS transporter